MLRIKELREELGLSQLDFAKKINLTQQSISLYEKGEREPSLDVLKSIADFFNVSTDYLLGKSNEKNPTINIDDVDVAFAAGLKGLNDTNKAIIKATLEALLAKQEKEDKKEN